MFSSFVVQKCLLEKGISGNFLVLKLQNLRQKCFLQEVLVLLETETKKFNKEQTFSGFGVCNLSQLANLLVFEDQPNGHKGQFPQVAVINGEQ